MQNVLCIDVPGLLRVSRPFPLLKSDRFVRQIRPQRRSQLGPESFSVSVVHDFRHSAASVILHLRTHRFSSTDYSDDCHLICKYIIPYYRLELPYYEKDPDGILLFSHLLHFVPCPNGRGRRCSWRLFFLDSTLKRRIKDGRNPLQGSCPNDTAVGLQ